MRLLSVMLVVLALALVGCGSSSKSSSSSTAAKTAAVSSTSTSTAGGGATAQFAAHAGIAFGVFHHYIYGPLLAGQIQALLKNKAAVAKATTAALLVVGEIKLATAAANSSASLKKLVTPLTVLSNGFISALTRLKTGKFKIAEIQSANIAIGSIEGTAASAGASIVERTPPLPAGVGSLAGHSPAGP
jgi:hypothetical protein